MKLSIPLSIGRSLVYLVWSVVCFFPSSILADSANPVAALQIAPGLKASLWATDPLIENPVAFSFNDSGRCYVVESHRWASSIFDITKQTSWLLDDLSFRSVSDRSHFLSRTFSTNIAYLTKDSERIRWIEDRDRDGKAESGGVFATDFRAPTAGTAAGILAMGTNVWFTCIPELWHLTSDSASGEASSRTALHTGFGVHIGVSGHDLHGLKMGPDGRLYFSMGDRGLRIESIAESKNPVGHGWQFSGNQPDTGAILRCEPDGSHLEVFAIGVRNPQELTFDAQGNLFTGDNDTAGPDDSRLLHIVEGGDYGWRCSYQHQAGFGPWVLEDFWRGKIDDLLPTCGAVAQGPAGLDFYPGTGMGADWNNHFLMCDFPGGVWDFTVARKGASFLVDSKRKLLWNLWPTDVEFGPDGGIFVADWVFGWGKPGKGRLFRLASERPEVEALARQTQATLQTGFQNLPKETLLRLLGHLDQRIRLRAQWALAERGAASVEVFSTLLSQSQSGLASLHAVWGLGQIGRRLLPGVDRLRVGQHLTSGLANSDGEIRAHCANQLGELRVVDSGDALLSLLSDPEPKVRFFAALSLGKFGVRENIAPVLELLATNADRDPYLRHAGMMALLGMADAQRLMGLHREASASVRKASLLALRRLQNKGVESFLSDSEPEIVEMAARAIHDAPINESMPALAAFLGKIDCPPKILSRSIDANLRGGEARNATVLAAFAGRADVPESARVDALVALGEWADAAPLDRVVGLWRPLPPRSAEPARRALRTSGAALFQSKSEAVRLALLHAATRLGVKEIGHGAFEALASLTTSKAVRLEVIRTLAGLKHSRWPEALQLALTDSEPDLQLEGLRLASEVPGAEIPQLLPSFLARTNEIRLRRAAFSILSRSSGQLAEATSMEWMNQLVSNQVEPALQLDVLEAGRPFRSAEIQRLVAEFEHRQPDDAFPGRWAISLAGGDASRGGQIFLEKPELACLRCHQVKGNGGPVGPSLDGVGTRLTREQILESILRPNAILAAGFEQTQLTLKDGSQPSGTVRKETETELTVENLEDGVVTLAKANIAQRQHALSAMPEGLGQLMSLRELRDLVEYLASLK